MTHRRFCAVLFYALTNKICQSLTIKDINSKIILTDTATFLRHCLKIQTAAIWPTVTEYSVIVQLEYNVLFYVT